MSTARTTALAASALLLIFLAACAPGGAPEPGGGAAAENHTQCIAGKTWVLDIADAASQLGAQLSSSGMNVTQSEGAGRQDFRFDENGTLTAHIDVTYTITVVNDELTLTLVQTHGGDPSGEWAWQGDSDNLTFSNWDNAGYSVQNQFIVNGVTSENAMTLPTETLGDGTVMNAACSGNSLTTTTTGSPFTQHWSAEG